jgi:signal transduction histidine kinase
VIRRDWWLDVVPAAVVVAVGLLGTLHVEATADERVVDALAVVLVVVAGGALLARRIWPLAVLVVVTAAIGAYVVLDYPGGPIFLAGPVALFSYAVRVERRTAYLVTAVVVTALLVTRVVVDREFGIGDLVLIGWGAVSVLAADAARGRGERRRFAEEQRHEELLRRLAEDRLQIARDLHDSVAHSMATINVQAGVAGHVLDRHPEQAAAALEAIRIASRDVLDELAAMLAVLREEGPAHRQPTPDLAALDGLVASSKRAGIAVDLAVDGDVATVPPAVSTAAYRIVQEALTNVARHGGVDRAEVAVHRCADRLDIEVLDAGVGVGGPVANGTGMGLVGIRERAAVTGGRCEIGRRETGGFRVAVSWDVPA